MAIQMANRTHVPALSCTISRMLMKMLTIGRSGRKGTCEGQEVPRQLSFEGSRLLLAKGDPTPPQPGEHCHTGDCTLGSQVSGRWPFLDSDCPAESPGRRCSGPDRAEALQGVGCKH